MVGASLPAPTYIDLTLFVVKKGNTIKWLIIKKIDS
jgi:hypothetical protein